MLTERFEWLGPIIDYISDRVDDARRAWEIFGDDVIRYVQRMFDAVSAVFSGVVDVIAGVVNLVSSLIDGDWSGVMDAMGQIASGALSILEGLFESAFAAIALAFTTVFQAIDEALGGWPSRIVGFVGDFFSAAIDIGKALVDGIVNGIKAAPGVVMDAIASLIPGSGILGDAANLLGLGGGDSYDLIGTEFNTPSASSYAAAVQAAYAPVVQVVMPDGRVLAETVNEHNALTGIQ